MTDKNASLLRGLLTLALMSIFSWCVCGGSVCAVDRNLPNNSSTQSHSQRHASLCCYFYATSLSSRLLRVFYRSPVSTGERVLFWGTTRPRASVCPSVCESVPRKCLIYWPKCSSTVARVEGWTVKSTLQHVVRFTSITHYNVPISGRVVLLCLTLDIFLFV